MRVYERPHRFVDDEADQIVRRVIAARSFSGEGVEADLEIIPDTDDLLLEQALVNRSQLLNAQVAVVDVTADSSDYLK